MVKKIQLERVNNSFPDYLFLPDDQMKTRAGKETMCFMDYYSWLTVYWDASCASTNNVAD